jgi:hypothetical protein
MTPEQQVVDRLTGFYREMEQALPGTPPPWRPGRPRHRGRNLGLAAAMVLMVGLLGLAVTQLGLIHRTEPTGQLTATERDQLDQLRQRPLRLPPMPADGVCPLTTHPLIDPYLGGVAVPAYGSGPVYAFGGPEIDTPKATYFDVQYITDPTVRGPVLIRGQQLDGRLQVFFVGPWAAGPVVGTDVIDGKEVQLHRELVLPASHKPAQREFFKPGWGNWPVRQGHGIGSNGCFGAQIDTVDASEVFVATSTVR